MEGNRGEVPTVEQTASQKAEIDSLVEDYNKTYMEQSSKADEQAGIHRNKHAIQTI